MINNYIKIDAMNSLVSWINVEFLFNKHSKVKTF